MVTSQNSAGCKHARHIGWVLYSFHTEGLHESQGNGGRGNEVREDFCLKKHGRGDSLVAASEPAIHQGWEEPEHIDTHTYTIHYLAKSFLSSAHHSLGLYSCVTFKADFPGRNLKHKGLFHHSPGQFLLTYVRFAKKQLSIDKMH